VPCLHLSPALWSPHPRHPVLQHSKCCHLHWQLLQNPAHPHGQ
jgi:hypothetical protein